MKERSVWHRGSNQTQACRMPDDTPGVNLKGYFQDKKGKEATPVSTRSSGHKFGPPPRIESNVAQRKGHSRGNAAKKSKPEEGNSSDDE